jgi:hypothetical protein
MKKIFFAVVAVVAMASCSKDEVIEVNREQIGFGEAFVENSTRAAIDNTYKAGKDIDEFKVWGTVKGTHTDSEEVVIFDGTEVTRPTDLSSGYNDAKAWLCNNVQYWVPNANYKFTAVVDGELNTNTIAYTVSSQSDLLLATATASVNDAGVVTGLNQNGLVAFTFNHLLSKAYFTFKTTDAFATDAYTYEISNIKFANAYTEGTYTVGGDWNATSTGELSFGNTVTLAPSKTTAVETTSEYARVFIPQKDIQVLFTITMKYGGKAVSVKEYNYTVFKETDAVKKSVAGHQYNFVVNVAENNSIQFTVNSDPVWTDGGNVTVQ